MIELADMMLRCNDQNPKERMNDDEQGVRISIFGEYATSQDAGRVALQWLRILTEVMPVICMHCATACQGQGHSIWAGSFVYPCRAR